MDWKNFFIRFAGLVGIAAGGLFLYAVVANILVLLHWMPDALNGQGFGYALTKNTLCVWAITILLGFLSLFVKENWRYVLYTSPLYAPCLFAVIFTLMHR